MHFETISPIIPGRFRAEKDILIFPFGYKCFLPFHFGLTPSACQASQAVPDLGASIHHPLCTSELIKTVLDDVQMWVAGIIFMS